VGMCSARYFGILADTPEHSRLELVHPVQPKIVSAGHARHAAILHGSAPIVEDRKIYPAEVETVVRSADDGCDVDRPKVEFEDTWDFTRAEEQNALTITSALFSAVEQRERRRWDP